jgi:hypothetical protein
VQGARLLKKTGQPVAAVAAEIGVEEQLLGWWVHLVSAVTYFPRFDGLSVT